MTRYMCAARIDERGRISGGKDGDQTGAEVMVQRYSNFGIDTVLRYEGANKYHVRNRMVRAGVGLANNNRVGYNQLRRKTSYKEIRAQGWKLKGIPKVGLCATDCSELVAICVNVGFMAEKVPSSNWTGSEAANLRKLGFKDVTGAVDKRTGEGLQPGDVLLNTNSHTAIYIGGKRGGSRYVKSYTVKRTRYLYPKPKKETKKRIRRLGAGTVLDYQHDKHGLWRKVKVGKDTGWVHVGKPAKAVKVREYC